MNVNIHWQLNTVIPFIILSCKIFRDKNFLVKIFSYDLRE